MWAGTGARFLLQKLLASKRPSVGQSSLKGALMSSHQAVLRTLRGYGRVFYGSHINLWILAREPGLKSYRFLLLSWAVFSQPQL